MVTLRAATPHPVRRTADPRLGRISGPGARDFLTLGESHRRPGLPVAASLRVALDALHRTGDFPLCAAVVMPTSGELWTIVIAKARTNAGPLGERGDERCLSWRGAQRRGHPSGNSAGLPRPPSRARNDKPYEFTREVREARRGDPAGLLRRDASRYDSPNINRRWYNPCECAPHILVCRIVPRPRQ